MSDLEISRWIDLKIANREPESLVCDYKANLELVAGEKRELAKDVTGFANEIGGVILIGIPEEKDDAGKNSGVPSLSYGINPKADFTLTLQNVIRNGVSPALPALLIREIPVTSNSSLVVYIVYHPQSWSRPHCVTLGDGIRYYRRTGKQTVPMQEHEVAALYFEKSTAQRHVETYLQGMDYGEKIMRNTSGLLKLAVVPLPVRESLVDIYSDEGRQLLRDNILFFGNGGNSWIPNRDGGITYSHQNPADSFGIAKIHHSGAFTFATELLEIPTGESITPGMVMRFAYSENVADFLQKYFSSLRFSGEVLVRVTAEDLKPEQLTIDKTRGTFAEAVPALLTDKNLVVEMVVSSNDVIANPVSVRSRLTDRIANLIGLWNAPTS